MRQLAATTDAGKDDHLVRRKILLSQGHLDRVQNAKIAASLTPRRRDGAVKILSRNHILPPS
jgi:hypothetical protein